MIRLRDLLTGTTLKIVFRIDSESEWIKANPVLFENEIAAVTDMEYVKIGDGITRFNNLNRATCEEIVSLLISD